MNSNNTKTAAKGNWRRRSRYVGSLSDRLATVRSYPGFGSSALTGILR